MEAASSPKAHPSVSAPSIHYMPLIEAFRPPGPCTGLGGSPVRRQSQHSEIAKAAIMNIAAALEEPSLPSATMMTRPEPHLDSSLMPPPKSVANRALGKDAPNKNLPVPAAIKDGVGGALTDTPVSTAPNSPQVLPRTNSGSSTPKVRATTLDIPGLTKSRVSPDGRIAQRDVGAKLVIVMVGLPARGKSYITKKMARYLNWLQHDTRIFNVGERRRVVAGGGQTIPETSVDQQLRSSVRKMSINTSHPQGIIEQKDMLPPPALSTRILVNGESPAEMNSDGEYYPEPANAADSTDTEASTKLSTPDELVLPPPDHLDQSASFFDPNNKRAVQIREQVALETLDDLLDYVLDEGGSVGILDATNSTLERRKMILNHIRERAGPELGVLFFESQCIDESLLESNMRLKLSGPDYKDQDPVKSLEDFKKRVANYEKSYVALGEYEEKNKISYVQMIDVGRKIIVHQPKGFLSNQATSYLFNFNLAPRQIWITRHGESVDNVRGRIGGDSPLSENGRRYAHALTRFVISEREAWELRQRERVLSSKLPLRPGHTTPPNPQYSDQTSPENRSFCVWTSMLKRSIETAQFFNDDEFELKEMKMLDELNSGIMEGMTYEEIRVKYANEYELRKSDKLHYRYPGTGGEGYLDIINRLRTVIGEVERMTDHVLLVGHRSIARVLLAYFLGLRKEDVAELDVPLGVLYMLEPKPYGVEFKVYRYNSETDWFDHEPNYEMRKAPYPAATETHDFK